MITKDLFETKILPITLKHEGGYVFDKDDKGGETYRGISKRANPDWSGWQLLEKHKPLTKGDIVNDRGLTEAVRSLYWLKYFESNKLHMLDSATKALNLFDFAVNGGYSGKRLQEICNEYFNAGLIIDGIVGDKTIQAVNSAPDYNFCNAVLLEREQYFNWIITKNPVQNKFYKGWLSRLDYMRSLSAKGLK